LTRTLAKQGVVPNNAVMSRPNSVKEFVCRLVITAPWLSKLGQGPPLMLPPLAKAQAVSLASQP
jgi:hypothetical protein